MELRSAGQDSNLRPPVTPVLSQLSYPTIHSILYDTAKIMKFSLCAKIFTINYIIITQGPGISRPATKPIQE